MALQAGAEHGHQVLLHIFAGAYQVLQVERGQSPAPGVIHRPAQGLAYRQKIGVRQGDGLGGPGAILAREQKLHIHRIGVTNGNGRLQPLEQHLVLAAKRVRPGFELAEVEHLPLSYQ